MFKAKFNHIFVEYFFPGLKIITLVPKENANCLPKFGFYVRKLTVVGTETLKFFIQQETKRGG